MLYLANSRVFQITAMFGLIVCGLVLLQHLSVPNESTVRADEPRDLSTEQVASPVASIQTYRAQQTKDNLRVSIRGITKGVAFLESQQPAIDGGRRRGNNVITRVRAAVLVERLGDEAATPGAVGIEFRTPDGEELVEKIKHEVAVDGTPTVVTGRGTGVAQLGHPIWRRATELFPTALPNVEKPGQSTVFLATKSGRVRATRTATFLFRFGKDVAQQEFVFENVPMP